MKQFRIVLSPDTKTVEKIREALKRNEGYCPCVAERNEDTKCICKKMKEEGYCCCGLYVSKLME